MTVSSNSDIFQLTAHAVREKILSRQLSASEVLEPVLQRIEALNDRLGAFVTIDADGARATATAVDSRIAHGEKVGLLAGVPVAPKDNMCTRNLRTSCASRILEQFCPPYDAHIVERLRAEDAVIVGKTNMDEFAMGSSTENSAFMATRNPWDTDRVPGGSSGGSAVAVAADLVHMALGSDTGGSIRQPAALCGIVGMKPTYGAVSRYGLVAFASSLDQIGPMTKDVTDAALLMNVISGHDRRDSTSARENNQDYLSEIDNAPSKIRIGVPKEYFGEGLASDVGNAVHQAIDLYKKLGAEIIDISLPHTEYAVATYYIICTAEASSNLARYDGVHYGFRSSDAADMIDMYSQTRAAGFGDEVKRRIMLGTYVLSAGYYDAYYLKACQVRSLIKSDFDKAFDKVDCIMGPTSPTGAFRIGEKTENPLEMYLSDIYTISANLAAIPAISIPCGFTGSGLPIGLQIMGKHFDEKRLLQIARAFERETDYHLKRPTINGT